jgi:hypothetical protein
MTYRDVKVYDAPFPTRDQILSGDPTAPPFPKEDWLQHVQPGEFAVRYKDFKTGLARNPQGEHVQSSEICRIFDSLAEARTNSRQVAAEHWTIMGVVYDHTGAQVEKIFNNKRVNTFALWMYAGILLWLSLFTFAGMALILIVRRLTLWALGVESTRPFTWLEWSVFAITGLAISIGAWFARMRWIAAKRVRKVRSSISSADKKYFEEINTLHGSSDPAERERFLKLAREYQDRVRQALKK